MTYSELIKFIIAPIVIYIGGIDYKKKVIPDKLNILIFILGIINVLCDYKNLNVYLLYTALVFTFFLLIAIFSNGAIGGGDIKLLTGLTLVFEADIKSVILVTYLAALIVIILGMIFKKLNLKGSIALGPFIALGSIVCIFAKF